MLAALKIVEEHVTLRTLKLNRFTVTMLTIHRYFDISKVLNSFVLRFLLSVFLFCFVEEHMTLRTHKLNPFTVTMLTIHRYFDISKAWHMLYCFIIEHMPWHMLFCFIIFLDLSMFLFWFVLTII